MTPQPVVELRFLAVIYPVYLTVFYLFNHYRLTAANQKIVYFNEIAPPIIKVTTLIQPIVFMH